MPATSSRPTSGTITSTDLTARFGFAGVNGTSDDPRERQLNPDLSSADTAALLTARDAADEKAAREALAFGVADAYFHFPGSGMDVEINDLVYLSFEY